MLVTRARKIVLYDMARSGITLCTHYMLVYLVIPRIWPYTVANKEMLKTVHKQFVQFEIWSQLHSLPCKIKIADGYSTRQIYAIYKTCFHDTAIDIIAFTYSSYLTWFKHPWRVKRNNPSAPSVDRWHIDTKPEQQK